MAGWWREMTGRRDDGPGSAGTARNVGNVLACGVFDCLLVLAVLAHAMPLAAALVLHVGAVLIVCVVIGRGTNDATFALLSCLGMMLMGPIGGLLAVVQMLALRLAPASHAADQAWFRTLTGVAESDPAEMLYEAIAQGRSFRPGAAPERYGAIMRSGSVAARQDVLGQIARRNRAFPPSLLRAGLTSRDLAVRASAAAVYAKLRERGAAPETAGGGGGEP